MGRAGAPQPGGSETSQIEREWTQSGRGEERPAPGAAREARRGDLSQQMMVLVDKIWKTEQEAEASARIFASCSPGSPRGAPGAAGQEGDGGGQPAPGHQHCQEVHEPRTPVPGSDSGGKHRPECGRWINSEYQRGYKFSTYATLVEIRQAIHARHRGTRRGRSGSRST